MIAAGAFLRKFYWQSLTYDMLRCCGCKLYICGNAVVLITAYEQKLGGALVNYDSIFPQNFVVEAWKIINYLVLYAKDDSLKFEASVSLCTSWKFFVCWIMQIWLELWITNDAMVVALWLSLANHPTQNILETTRTILKNWLFRGQKTLINHIISQTQPAAP